MARLHPDDIQAIAERVVFLLDPARAPKEQTFKSDFGLKVIKAKAEFAQKKARRTA